MGFSAGWLSLREPADHAARDTALLRAAARAAGERAVVVDLGCGAGSTRRAFGGMLRGATWRMVDADPALLALAGGEGFALDLNRIDDLPLEGATLVTASALIDLCSADWIDALVARLAARRLPFYAALSYDGIMGWNPPHPADDAVTAAFNRHQGGDKGFGPALGPGAADYAAQALRGAGYRVETALSPWRLGPAQAALQRELLGGIAQAAAEAGATGTDGWLAARIAALGSAACRIGHVDLLALPPAVTETEGG